MGEISEHIEDVECDFYVGHPLEGYSVTVTPDEESENVLAEFRGPSIDGGAVIKKGSPESLRSLNFSLNNAKATSLTFQESGTKVFLKLFGDAVAASDLDQFESERKNKEGRGFR